MANITKGATVEQQYNKKYHGKTTNTTNITKDATTKQLIQQI